ncbi:hypothetical protein E8E13_010618 [Curvularia kusanoi]|uniref:NAD-dependent epimerase/dehydratase domain-containing protein n=1 Tax=Curvularia kusanoi TaxID=90978 RepID=A0A9P4TJY0_CURKU|nr:hypothetical protein E8E13_010618 [Curvularia kusanoi]
MSQSLIFITGATGFIGSHVALQALEAGYKLRVSVRKEAQIDTLRSIFSSYADQIDFVVIPDLSKPGAFASALQDVAHVFHVASPMPGKGDDFEQGYLQPAVKGTTTLLDTAQGFSTIKRVVIVSSVLSLMPMGAVGATEPIIAKGKCPFPLRKPPINTPKEGLNPSLPVDPKMSFPDDPQTAAGLKYHASKILAHRATLEWAATHKPSFNIISLHPSFVFGRSLTQTSAGALDGSNGLLWAGLTGPRAGVPMVAVDVRDVAAAHIKALTVAVDSKDKVTEFILSASEREGWTWGGVAQFAKEKYAAVGVQVEAPYPPQHRLETTRAETLLGIKWRAMQDTVSAFLEQQLELQVKL